MVDLIAVVTLKARCNKEEGKASNVRTAMVKPFVTMVAHATSITKLHNNLFRLCEIKALNLCRSLQVIPIKYRPSFARQHQQCLLHNLKFALITHGKRNEAMGASLLL